MKIKYYILICIIFLQSCEYNSTKTEVIRGTYSISFEYCSNKEDTFYTFASLKKIYPKDKSVYYLIFGKINNKGGIDINENSPYFLMKENTITISKNELFEYLKNKYSPSIWVFNVESNKVNPNISWDELNNYTDSLIFDFSIIDVKDLE